MSYVGVGDCAREIRARRPKDISDLFYHGVLDGLICPVVANRRLIPRSYVPTIRAVLADRGLLLDQQETALA